MILVAYFWITENVEVVTEMIRDFYNEPLHEDMYIVTISGTA